MYFFTCKPMKIKQSQYVSVSKSKWIAENQTQIGLTYL